MRWPWSRDVVRWSWDVVQSCQNVSRGGWAMSNWFWRACARSPALSRCSWRGSRRAGSSCNGLRDQSNGAGAWRTTLRHHGPYPGKCRVGLGEAGHTLRIHPDTLRDCREERGRVAIGPVTLPMGAAHGAMVSASMAIVLDGWRSGLWPICGVLSTMCSLTPWLLSRLGCPAHDERVHRQPRFARCLVSRSLRDRPLARPTSARPRVEFP